MLIKDFRCIGWYENIECLKANDYVIVNNAIISTLARFSDEKVIVEYLRKSLQGKSRLYIYKKKKLTKQHLNYLKILLEF